MATVNFAEINRSANMVDIAGRYTKLHELTGQWSGPCPNPNCTSNDDGFRIPKGEPHRWYCRQCNTRGASAIDFVMMVERYSNPRDAAFSLQGNVLLNAPQRPIEPVGADAQRRRKRVVDTARLLAKVDDYHNFLLDAPDASWTRQYLTNRGIDGPTWAKFQLGCMPRAIVPGTNGSVRADAVMIPWIIAGHAKATVYRFTSQTKLKYKRVGTVSGYLFGGQAIAPRELWPERTLLLIEGEINAMSVWQTAIGQDIDVLSFGVEAAQLPPAMLQLAQEWRRCIVWADRPEIAEDKARGIPGAEPYTAREDANDQLQSGRLANTLQSFSPYPISATVHYPCSNQAAFIDSARSNIHEQIGN